MKCWLSQDAIMLFPVAKIKIWPSYSMHRSCLLLWQGMTTCLQLLHLYYRYRYILDSDTQAKLQSMWCKKPIGQSLEKFLLPCNINWHVAHFQLHAFPTHITLTLLIFFRNVVKAFYNSSLLFEVLTVFGPLSEDVSICIGNYCSSLCVADKLYYLVNFALPSVGKLVPRVAEHIRSLLKREFEGWQPSIRNRDINSIRRKSLR